VKHITRVNDDIQLIQDSEFLSFGTDALLLAAYMRPGVAHSKRVAVELGAGSGIISLLAAKRGKFGRIYAVEVQHEQHEICVENIALNALEEQIVPIHADLRDIRTDIWGHVDAVFANPPFFPPDSGRLNQSETKTAARHEIHGGIADFTSCAGRLLNEGGLFYCVYRPDRLDVLLSSLEQAQLMPKRLTFVQQTPSHSPSLVLCEARRGNNRGMIVTPPLILKSGGRDSDDYSRILETGSFMQKFYT